MRLRWGICGAGKISSDFVNASKLLPESEHQVKAVAASTDSKAKAFAEKYNIPLSFGSYEKLMKCSEIDIIYIGVINVMHKDQVLSALNNGKHVLCEKPMGMNATEVKEMVTKAKEKKLCLMEAFWTRFFPIYRLIKAKLNANEIGEPKFLQITFCVDLPTVTLTQDILAKNTSGGALLCNGCYCTMLSSFIFGAKKPLKITASGILNEYGTDETGSVMLEYEGNKMAQFLYSAALFTDNKATIIGTKGHISIPNTFWSPTEAIINGQLHKVEPPPGSSDHQYNFPNSWGLCYEASCIRECILSGNFDKCCPIMPLEESILLAEINDEILRQLNVR